MISTICSVKSIEQVSSSVSKVILKADSDLSFKAGQYLHVVMNDKDKRPFSIANAPNHGRDLELHIGAAPSNTYAHEVLQKCHQEGKVTVEVGLGNAYLRQSPLPAIIVAGGTGYSYAKSLLYALVNDQPERNIFIYWGAKHIEDLYEFESLTELAENYEKLNFRPVIEHPYAGWDGRTGWVHHAVLNDFETLEACQVYTAGRFEMASAIRQDFIARGLDLAHLFGDAYSFI